MGNTCTCKNLAHPRAELGLSHVSTAGLDPTPDTAVRVVCHKYTLLGQVYQYLVHIFSPISDGLQGCRFGQSNLSRLHYQNLPMQ